MGVAMIDRTGLVVGAWTVIGFDRKDEKSGFRWFCRCQCGTVRSVLYGSLYHKASLSCGCVGGIVRAQKNTRHGMAGSPTYKSWHAMHQRCDGKGGHESYVDRGISVDERWNSFETFLQDMGARPKGKTLDRKDNTKGYNKENCRWATLVEQANNRETCRYFDVFGEQMTLAEVSRKYGVGISKLRHCVRKGQTVEEAMKPQKGGARVKAWRITKDRGAK